MRLPMRAALTFDMYGTLVDPLGIARALERQVADPEQVARRWRETQLRYAALLAAMEHYHDFGWVTERALDHALAVCGEELDASTRAELVAAYDRLDAFRDTRPGLERLRAAGHTLAVFSNGTRAMIERVVGSAGIADCFDDLISVDEVGTFKPSPRVYLHAAARVGQAPADTWLVSANPFDVVGAATAGLRTAWIDRGGAAFDPLGPEPEIVVGDLGALADALG
jgi:2-haloacid dehalogenase